MQFLDYIHLGFIQLILAPRDYQHLRAFRHLSFSNTTLNVAVSRPEEFLQLRGLIWALSYKAMTSEFYLHLTYNTETGPDFMSGIRLYITSHEHFNWWVLEFCEMPEYDQTFSCRLIRTSDRHKLSEFLDLFSDLSYNTTGLLQKENYLNYSEEFRERMHQFGILMAQSGRFIRKPNLFIPDAWSNIHRGPSRLHEKVIGDNPEASIFTNMSPLSIHQNSRPEHAYYPGRDFYNVRLPLNELHHYDIVFQSAISLTRIYISTGDPVGGAGGILDSAVVETSGHLLNTLPSEARCADWRMVGTLMSGLLDLKKQPHVSVLQRPVQCIRITVTSETMGRTSLNATALYNIAVFVQK